jgi:hypothetical protein
MNAKCQLGTIRHISRKKKTDSLLKHNLINKTFRVIVTLSILDRDVTWARTYLGMLVAITLFTNKETDEFAMGLSISAAL